MSPHVREGHGDDKGSSGTGSESDSNFTQEATSPPAQPTSHFSHPCHVDSGPLPPTVPINQMRAAIFTSADMQPLAAYSYTRPDSLTPSSFSVLPGNSASYHGTQSQAPSLSNGSSPYISPVGYYPTLSSHQQYPGGGRGRASLSSSPPPYSSQLYLSSYDPYPRCHPPPTSSAHYSPQEPSVSPTMGNVHYMYSPQTPGNPIPPADHTHYHQRQPNLPPSMNSGALPLSTSSLGIYLCACVCTC